MFIKTKSHFIISDHASHVTACHHWSWGPSFDHWYLIFSFLECILTFVQALLLIFKHAMFLRHSNTKESALNLAGLKYQKGDIDSKIQDYLKASSPEPSVEEIMSFIMATDIGMFIVALLF